MNVERLHAIASAVRADLENTAAVGTMQELRDALRNQVNAPGDAGFQQQVADARQRLETSLAGAASNEFPPTWLHVLEELGVESLLGSTLFESVREIFVRNEITPTIAADAIDVLTGEMEQLQGGLDQLLAGLSHFEIGSEELEPGTAEVGLLIPRPSVDGELRKLGDEFAELQKLFGPFLELASGSRPPLIVSTISSSEFGVSVEMLPQAAALIAVACERIIATYKSILGIRRLRQELSDEGVAGDQLAGVDDHANSRMADEIDLIVKTLIDESENSDSGRQNELRIELKLSLSSLAYRIDRGYNIDVRATAVSPEDEDAPGGSGDERALQVVIDTSPKLRFINRVGEPILSLPEASADDSKQSEEPAGGPAPEGQEG